MFRWEILFFLITLAASVAGKILPADSVALLASKGVFVVSFVLFAGALLANRRVSRQEPDDARRDTASVI